MSTYTRTKHEELIAAQLRMIERAISKREYERRVRLRREALEQLDRVLRLRK